MPRRSRRGSMESDSSSASSPERATEDDNESFTEHPNDSESSLDLDVSLEEMDLDAMEEDRQIRLSPISRLPAELLIAVFSRLSSPSDLLSCMLVSKAWARNSVDLLWHRPVTNKWKYLVNVVQTARKTDGYFAYHDLIKRLNLGQLRAEVSDGTLQPLAICKRIERLTLPGCSHLTDASLVPMIEGNRSLMAVDLSDLEMITDRSMHAIAKNCYRLQGLNVTGCTGLTDDSMVEVAKNCRRLKRLKLNNCMQLTDLSVTAFADNCHDMLEIDLLRCVNITDMSVTALIKNGRQLRELRLVNCSRITDDAFLQLPSENRYEALRILDLTDCNEIQDAALQKIVAAAPRLRNLVLAKCRNITDRGVMAITKLGKNLHFLHLGHCSQITDYGVQALIRHCNRIRYIDFSCCHNLTDDSVSLLAGLPKLKRIGLVKCANITDASLRELARPKTYDIRHFSLPYAPNNLERLHLSYCTNLTIPGVRHLLINCPQLTHLSLTGVQPFLRDDFLQFCRDAPNEFNDHQRDVFCVFSGHGVYDLREWLRDNYPSPPAPNPHDDILAQGHLHPGMGMGMASSAPTTHAFFPHMGGAHPLPLPLNPPAHQQQPQPQQIPGVTPGYPTTHHSPQLPPHIFNNPYGGHGPHTQWIPPPFQPWPTDTQTTNQQPTQPMPIPSAQAQSAPGNASFMSDASTVTPSALMHTASLNTTSAPTQDPDASLNDGDTTPTYTNHPAAPWSENPADHEDHFHFEPGNGH